MILTIDNILLCWSYWVGGILWGILTYTFTVKLFKARRVSPESLWILAALTLLSLARFYSDLQDGLMVNAKFWILPQVFYTILSQTNYLIIPRLAILAAGLVMAFIVQRMFRET